MRFVELHERASHSEAKGTGLTRGATALEIRLDVITTERVGRRERLLNRADQRRPREVVAKRATVDVPLTRTGLEIDAAHGLLAAADGVDALRVGHVLL